MISVVRFIYFKTTKYDLRRLASLDNLFPLDQYTHIQDRTCPCKMVQGFWFLSATHYQVLWDNFVYKIVNILRVKGVILLGVEYMG